MSDKKAHKRAVNARLTWDTMNADEGRQAKNDVRANWPIDLMADHSSDPDLIIEAQRQRFGTYSWQGQTLQYDQIGEPDSIVYRRFTEALAADRSGPAIIDTLLYYDEEGKLAGILNTYPLGAVGDRYIEEPGNINTFIRPGMPEAVHDRLIADANKRWTGLAEVDLAEGARAFGGEDGNRRFSRMPDLNR